jgi:hypothetical protein
MDGCLRTGALLALGIVAGCGGSSSGGSSGALSLALTDGPVDGVGAVVVEFTGVTLKPQGGTAFDVPFDVPLAIDLKALHSGNSELVLDGEAVPAGEYEWVRLNVNADFDNVLDSYVTEEGGGQVELRVPSGDNSGLKLVSGFAIVAGGEASFVIDWNLRQGLVEAPGQQGYKLQPALRIIDMQEYGAIAGTVATSLVTAEACTSDPNTGEGNAVYIYAGAGVTPDDIDGNDPEPLATAEVRLDNSSGNHEYVAPYLAPGAYTVAFTCMAGDDSVPDGDLPNQDTDDAIAFTAGIDATVTDGNTTTVNIEPIT